MKKQITLFVVSLFMIATMSLKSQTPLTTAVDFTATDSHGNSFNLFNILNGGQYVLIDFFYTTCGPCQASTPHIVSAYSRYGCNEKDVFFIAVSPSDNNTAVQSWDTQYGITYPSIGTDGGGTSICNSYGITAYPTVILIAPNKTIVEQDIWPVTNLDAAFSTHGIAQQTCTYSIASYASSEQKISIYPNPASAYLMVETEMEVAAGSYIEILDITGSLLMKNFASNRNHLNISHLSSGFYIVRIGNSFAKFSKN